MSDAPERIWLQALTPDYRDGWSWCWHPIGETDLDEVEYVRADLYQSPSPDGDRDAMDRDHEALEKLRAKAREYDLMWYRGDTFFSREGRSDGETIALVSQPRDCDGTIYAQVSNSHRFDDPADAILGGSDE